METLSDPTFAVSANALRLVRSVEMYQWVEHVETETRKKTGGKTEKVKTYSYAKEWKSEHVPSSEPMLARVPRELRRRARLHDGGFYFGADAAAAKVGDLRVRFSRVAPADVSVIARQSGDELAAYQTEAGDALEMLAMGNASPDQMFTSAEQSNAVLTWALRLFGFLIMAAGVALVFRPLVVVADVIPLIGDIVGVGTGLVAVALAAPLSLATIGLAWIFYRPLLGIFLLALAVGIVFVAKNLAARRKSAPLAAARA